METITIQGIKYEILDAVTIREAENSFPALAEEMRSRGQSAHLYLRRPRGLRGYLAVRDDCGRVGPATKLPGI